MAGFEVGRAGESDQEGTGTYASHPMPSENASSRLLPDSDGGPQVVQVKEGTGKKREGEQRKSQLCPSRLVSGTSPEPEGSWHSCSSYPSLAPSNWSWPISTPIGSLTDRLVWPDLYSDYSTGTNVTRCLLKIKMRRQFLPTLPRHWRKEERDFVG